MVDYAVALWQHWVAPDVLPFILQLLTEAWSSSVASMGTTSLAIGGALLYPLADLGVQFKHNGLSGVKQHWGESLRYSVLIAAIWWSGLFCFHLFYKVPNRIGADAARNVPPAPPWPHVAVPELRRGRAKSNAANFPQPWGPTYTLTPGSEPMPSLPDWLLEHRAQLKKMAERFPDMKKTVPLASDEFWEDLESRAMRLYAGTAIGFSTKLVLPLLSIAGKTVLTMYRAGDNISISAEFYNDRDEMITAIDHNRLLPNFNKIWRFGPEHPNGHSIVVYNESGDVTLSIRYLNNRAVKLLGRFIYHGRQIEIREDRIFVDGVPAFENTMFGDNALGMIAVQ